MDKVRVIIVEDELIIAENIRESLEDYGYDVLGVAISADEALNLIEQSRPDVMLLDITIKGSKDGIHLAATLNKRYQIPFIFITSHGDKATIERAKVVNPYGYLVKPFEEEAIFAAIEIALYNFEKRAMDEGGQAAQDEIEEKSEEFIIKDAIFIKHQKMFLKIKFSEILWFQADGNYTIVNTATDKYSLRNTLKNIESKIPGTVFSRVHKSYIVKLDAITAIDTNFVYLGEQMIPLSRNVHRNLVRSLNFLSSD